jgi:hypothetical protein
MEEALAAATREKQMNAVAVSLNDGAWIADANGSVTAFFMDQHLFRPRSATVLAALHEQVDVPAVFAADFAALEEQEKGPLRRESHDRDAVRVVPVGVSHADVLAEVDAVFLTQCRSIQPEPQRCEQNTCR